MLRVARDDANSLLQFFDKMGNAIQKNPAKFGLTPAAAKVAMTYVDSSADDFERKTFGEDSMSARQAEMMSQREGTAMETQSDEPYMSAFANPQAPIQTESDEPYMSEFNTDTSSEVSQQYPTGTFLPRQAEVNPFD